MLRVFVISLISIAGLVLVIRCVRDDVRVLCSYETQGQLKQALKSDTYCVTDFSQDGRNYVGIRVDSSRVGVLLNATHLFHQSAPYYVFDDHGQRVDFSKNFNDDHAFIHRWPGLFPTIRSCKCGLNVP